MICHFRLAYLSHSISTRRSGSQSSMGPGSTGSMAQHKDCKTARLQCGTRNGHALTLSRSTFVTAVKNITTIIIVLCSGLLLGCLPLRSRPLCVQSSSLAVADKEPSRYRFLSLHIYNDICIYANNKSRLLACTEPFRGPKPCTQSASPAVHQ